MQVQSSITGQFKGPFEKDKLLTRFEIRNKQKLIRVSCALAKKSIENASFQNLQNEADSDWNLYYCSFLTPFPTLH